MKKADESLEMIKNGGDKFICIGKKIGEEVLWGFMDGNGKEVIPCRYRSVKSFSDGMARVEDEEGGFFFINESGETVFMCDKDYEYGFFVNGRCKIYHRDGSKDDYVNKLGEIIAPENNPENDQFSEGLQANNDDWGYSPCPCEWVNEKRNVVINGCDLDFYRGSDFCDRLASALHTEYRHWYYGYLDQRGEVVIPFVFTYAMDWDHGMAPVSCEGEWAFIDLDMNVLIPFQDLFRSDDWVDGFLTGMDFPPMFDKDGVMLYGKWVEDSETDGRKVSTFGAIDRSGRELIPVDTGDNLSNNKYYGIAKIDGKIAVLTNVENKEGKYEKGVKWFDIEDSRDRGYVYDFECKGIHLRKVAKLEGGLLRWGFSDSHNREVISCKFEDAMVRNGVIRVKKDGLWAFVTEKGQFLTPFIYQSAFAPFAEGLSAVQRDGLWGFINEKGEEVVPCKYDAVKDFEEGRSKVLLEENYGFIDERGKEVVPLISPIVKYNPENEWISEGLWVNAQDPRFGPFEWVNEKENVVIVGRDPCIYEGGDFHDRLAYAYDYDDGSGYLDQRGEVVIPFVFTNVTDWDHGMAPVSNEDGKWGFIDLDMNVLIPFQYYFDGFPPRFNKDGLMFCKKLVERDSETGEPVAFTFGAIDRSGRELIPVDTRDNLSKNKYYGIAKIDGKIAVLTDVENKEGKYEKGVKWFDIEDSSDRGYVYDFECKGIHLRKVAKLEGGLLRWGFSDSHNREVISCEFEDAMVRNGVIRVKKDGLWAFVTEKGQFLTPFIYQSAFAPFAEGLSAVQRDGLWGFINEKGEEVVPCKYDAVKDFKEGRSVVLLEENYGFIDESGKEVVPLIYEMAYPFSGDLARVRSCEGVGYINRDGEEVIPCWFDDAGEYSEGLVCVREWKGKDLIPRWLANAGKYHYMVLDTSGNTVIDLAGIEPDDVSIFKEGLCGIMKHWRWGFIDRTGKEVIPCKFKYHDIDRQIQFIHGLCFINSEEQRSLVGAIDKRGEVVIPTEYRRIRWDGEEQKWVAETEEGEIHYYDEEGKRI